MLLTCAAVRMGVTARLGNQPAEDRQRVRADGRVGVLVDQNAGGGVPDENMAETLPQAARRQRTLDLGRDVEKLLLLAAANREGGRPGRLHHSISSQSSAFVYPRWR